MVPVPSAQQIRFCRSRDGVSIAYASTGDGPVLVKAANWVTHLDHDFDSVVWRHWVAALGHRRTLIRYDARGCGLGQRNDVDFSFDKYVEDLEAVVDAAAPERFALFGFAGGGATAVAYAARHPSRVTQLVLYGAFVRGRFARSRTTAQLEEEETLLRLIEIGWGRDDPSFRQLFVSQFLPEANPAQIRSFNALMRQTTSPANAAALMRAWFAADVSRFAPLVRCPTLVLHPRDAIRVPFEEGRELAGLIPGARLVPLESANLILLEEEKAWQSFVGEIDAFLSDGREPATAGSPGVDLEILTARERDVLELVARGMDNDSIARQLGITTKTARNHVSAILGKLDLHNRAQVIVRAREAGIGIRGR